MSMIENSNGRFDAIVIGASAGGVEAIAALLPALSPQLQAAVFIVIHQPRERPSLLVDILKDRCVLPVQEAQDKEMVQRGRVYVAPPDYHLLLDTGPQLALSVDEPVEYSRPSIDVLFESAADLYAERLLGIILTGGNQDGAAGLAAVHREGGTTIVQSPEDAQIPHMPEAALKRHPADYVLPLEQMTRLLHTLDRSTT